MERSVDVYLTERVAALRDRSAGSDILLPALIGCDVVGRPSHSMDYCGRQTTA